MRPLVAWLCSLALGQAQYTGPPPELETAELTQADAMPAEMPLSSVLRINPMMTGSGAKSVVDEFFASHQWLLNVPTLHDWGTEHMAIEEARVAQDRASSRARAVERALGINRGPPVNRKSKPDYKK